MSDFKYFSSAEFHQCTPPCSILQMNGRFLSKLDEARELAKTPFKLNSAYRTKAYEKTQGRPGTSSHCKGLAVDISCPSSFVRFHIVSALIKVGFRRIGVYPTFIHVDDDEDKISALWLDKDFTFQ